MQRTYTLAVAGFLTNSAGQVLLVRTYWRSDTWELPGGQVEAGETPVTALVREVQEETGLDCEITSATGTYVNLATRVVVLTFAGITLSGELQLSSETSDVLFVEATEAALCSRITRPHLRTRALDALRSSRSSYAAYRTRPYLLLEQLIEE